MNFILGGARGTKQCDWLRGVGFMASLWSSLKWPFTRTNRFLYLLVSVVSGHYIDERRETSPIINLEAIWNILAPSAWFLAEYLTVFLFSLAFVHLLGRFLRKRSSLVPHFVYNLFTQTNSFFKRSTAVGLFFVSNLLFLFIVQQILTNNVKTGEFYYNQWDNYLISIMVIGNYF